MQIKYIVATIASLAVSSAIAGPVAEPVANEFANPNIVARAEAATLAEAGAQGAVYNKKLHAYFGEKLLQAYKKNYDGKTARPTLKELLELKERSRQSEATDLQSKEKREAWGGSTWHYSWKWKNGFQTTCFPFATYGHHFEWNLHHYYTCWGTYPDRGADDDKCDCDYAYC